MIIRTELGGNDSPTRTIEAPGVGWEYTADNLGAVAIGPRIFSTVSHILPSSVVYRGETYEVTSRLRYTTGNDDSQFLIVDRDLPGFCQPYLDNGLLAIVGGEIKEGEFYIVATGEGSGQVNGDTYYWGSNTMRKRWARSTQIMSFWPTFRWKFMEGASASQDSGGGIFYKVDGQLKYIGAVQVGTNPTVVDGFTSGGLATAWIHRADIAQYLDIPPAGLQAPVISDVTILESPFGRRISFHITCDPNYDLVIEKSFDMVNWEIAHEARTNSMVYSDLAEHNQCYYRASSRYGPRPSKALASLTLPMPPIPQ